MQKKKKKEEFPNLESWYVQQWNILVTRHVFALICFLLPAVTEAGKVGDPLAEDFFREEYILNNAIGKRYTFNYTCIMTHLYVLWGLIH